MELFITPGIIAAPAANPAFYCLFRAPSKDCEIYRVEITNATAVLADIEFAVLTTGFGTPTNTITGRPNNSALNASLPPTARLDTAFSTQPTVPGLANALAYYMIAGQQGTGYTPSFVFERPLKIKSGEAVGIVNLAAGVGSKIYINWMHGE